MILIYLLLGVIAIGVLLCSEEGQKILRVLITLLILLGVITGLAIVIIIVLFLNKETKDTILNILGIIMLVGSTIYGIYLLNKKIKSNKLTIKIIKNKTTNFFITKWRESKMKSIVSMILILLCLLFWVILPFTW